MLFADFIARQARRPSGPFGWLLARIWIAESARANQAALEVVDVRREDRVLEIGFGHGRTIGRAAGTATRGLVAGVDTSPLMLRVAGRHNAEAIREGRIDLRLSDGVHVPFDNGAFDKVFSVHTLHFWPDPKATLEEIHRVMKRGGRLVLGSHAAEDGAMPDRYPPSVYRFHTRDQLGQWLEGAGFTGVQVEARKDAGNAPSWALARKP
jgi:SAM-dependent methyltransferase